MFTVWHLVAESYEIAPTFARGSKVIISRLKQKWPQSLRLYRKGMQYSRIGHAP
jgi:hypothetical protein